MGGTVTGGAAVVTAFFTFHWIIGVLALFAGGVGWAVMLGFMDELKEANPEEFSEDGGEQYPGQAASEAVPKASPEEPLV